MLVITTRKIFPFSLLVLLTACALVPPAVAPLPDASDVSGIHAFLRNHHAEDARFQTVHDRPFLKADFQLRYRMQGFPKSGSFEQQQEFLKQFVQDAAELGEREISLAAEWVSPVELAQFNSSHGVASTSQPYDDLIAAYHRASTRLLNAELAVIDKLADENELTRYWHALNKSLEESPMTQGRLARKLLNAPAVPFIKGWIAYHNWHDYRGPLTPNFNDFVAFESRNDLIRPHNINTEDWTLLSRYAPVIVQERNPKAGYLESFDHFGEVVLHGETLDGAMPEVNAQQPAVYAYLSTKRIQNVDVRQLNYTIWYPQHPELSPLDPEAGPLDGWTIRVNLDAEDRPLLVESMSNCGCYYKIFPSERLEKVSSQTFSYKLDGKTWFLENHVDKGVDAVVPEIINGLTEKSSRVTVFMSAGSHHLISIRAQAQEEPYSEKSAQPYALVAYDELEQLPFQDHKASMFAPDGLVRHAHRRECSLLSPSGVYHAGHPRQRETQMIYFDEADFDAPNLLEHYLRLPPGAFKGGV